MELFFVSFIGGVLTVLAPCILPVLPITLGAGVTSTDKKRPYIIVASLGASIFLFTILLKASTLLIDIHPDVWKYISGGIIIFFGIISLFPSAWDKISDRLGFSRRSEELLTSSKQKQGILGSILIGASLGPVFSSCSPTYSLILATVLPVSFAHGLVYIASYTVGLMSVLLFVVLLGQRAISRIRWAANPYGIFKRILGIIFILVGVLIISGYDKKFQTFVLDSGFLDITKIEQQLLPFVVPSVRPGTIRESNNQGPLMNISSPFPAPELTGIDAWINSNGETIGDLKGKVVIVDFWTYSCINCLRTLPYLKSWYSKYKDRDFVILGIHAPEFAFEQKFENVQEAVNTEQIEYPVGLDNDFATWRAYRNRYWPAKYFIDRQGQVRHYHFGEGAYAESEMIIQKLLNEGAQERVAVEIETEAPTSPAGKLTHETYLGYARNSGEEFVQKEPFQNDTAINFAMPDTLESGQWALSGSWKVEDEKVTALKNGSELMLMFSAKEVYLVIEPNKPGVVKITNNNSSSTRDLRVDRASLYTVTSLPELRENQTVRLSVPAGFSLHAFTFGG